jgi:hypothetical protein
MTGEAQQSLHLARPVFLLAVFLLDFDERFQLAEMMRIAQCVKHAGLVHVFDRRLGHEAAHRCGNSFRRAAQALLMPSSVAPAIRTPKTALMSATRRFCTSDCWCSS